MAVTIFIVIKLIIVIVETIAPIGTIVANALFIFRATGSCGVYLLSWITASCYLS